MRRGRALRKRYGRAGRRSIYPRIHIIISRDVTAFREEAGDKFAIEARMQKVEGGDWILIGLRFSPTEHLARDISREIRDSVKSEYKPGSPIVTSVGPRAFGDFVSPTSVAVG